MKQLKTNLNGKLFAGAFAAFFMVACGSSSSGNLFEELEKLREGDGLASVQITPDSLYGLWEHSDETKLIKIEENRLTFAIQYSELCGDRYLETGEADERIYEVKIPIEVISEDGMYGQIRVRSAVQFPKIECFDESGNAIRGNLSLAANHTLAFFGIRDTVLNLNDYYTENDDGIQVFSYDTFYKVSDL